MSEMMTCPKCGALIVPQLARCRQCKTYLHGTALEGSLVELLPERLAQSPGTGVAVLFILVYYLLMVGLAGPTSLVGFSSYTLLELGALQGPSLLRGEYWRYVTYMFGHHDLVHLAFNLVSLMAVGPVVEQLFDRKKMFLTYVVAGVAGGVASLIWYVYLTGGMNALFVSTGASGAVSGMIGAALIGARRMGFEGRELYRDMGRWTIYMVIWGVAMSGINNAAHLGGFLAGAGLAAVMQLGHAGSVWKQRGLSVLALATLAVILASTGLMIRNAAGFPTRLEADYLPRSILGFRYYRGGNFEMSDQRRLSEECVRRAAAQASGPDDVYACELAVRAYPYFSGNYYALEGMLLQQGEVESARELQRVIDRLFPGGAGLD